ncbi:iron-containing redox enzyme family protein [Rhodococcus gannanensis]|uniref:Iron-containing redox enzyme family protein n=1 Tax=Rhodococcus gannanensis TaxID=1960308 RepID=A0ABW4P546_9NOCA
MTTGVDVRARPLPMPRGPVSCRVIATLADGSAGSMRADSGLGHADPLGGDLQLALHVCYELHYRGFVGVDPDWEWDPELIRLRGDMERRFLRCLRAEVAGGSDADAELDAVSVAEAGEGSVAAYLRDHGSWDQMREYFAHRSIYHLKEADPLAWAIPRLHGPPKAAFVAVEFDEFGGGDGERMHSRLFSDLLRAAELDSSYLGYLDDVPPETLATVNLVSLFGLHRGLRGALVGHFATAEATTPPSAKALVAALERMSAPAECVRFYAEHVEADAVHEQVLRRDVVGGLLDAEPELAADVVFGIQATELLEGRLAAHLLHAWSGGASSLLAVRESRLHGVGAAPATMDG